MDDIRRPNDQRRDFAARHRGYQPRPAGGQPIQPAPRSVPPPPAAPEYAQPAYQQPTPQPDQVPYHETDAGFAPVAAGADDYEHYSQPAPQARPQPAAKPRRLPKVPAKYAVGAATALILIIASAYMLTRPAKTTGFSVAQLSKKSTFGFYYPQPLPSGYSYVTKINAFQGGQAYFMLANGSKHIVFHEQPAAGQGVGGLTAAQTIQTASGKASIGTLAGQPAAKVLAASTLISVNTTGPVPTADLTKAISNLKTDR